MSDGNSPELDGKTVIGDPELRDLATRLDRLRLDFERGRVSWTVYHAEASHLLELWQSRIVRLCAEQDMP